MFAGAPPPRGLEPRLPECQSGDAGHGLAELASLAAEGLGLEATEHQQCRGLLIEPHGRFERSARAQLGVERAVAIRGGKHPRPSTRDEVRAERRVGRGSPAGLHRTRPGDRAQHQVAGIVGREDRHQVEPDAPRTQDVDHQATGRGLVARRAGAGRDRRQRRESGLAQGGVRQERRRRLG